MLEEHVVPFLRRWHSPLGFFGEQGGESIHKDFVQLASTFSHVKPSTMRLKKMLEEHHLVVHPKNRELIPEKRKRNLKETSTTSRVNLDRMSAFRSRMNYDYTYNCTFLYRSRQILESFN